MPQLIVLFTELKNSLKNGVASAYLAQGNDVFLVNKSIELILNSAGISSMNVVRLDEDAKTDAIFASLSNMSMFGEKTAVVVRGNDFAKIYLAPIKSDKEFTKVECNPMDESTVVKLIMQNKKFNFETAVALAKMCENNYANVSNEMQKIDSFYIDKSAVTVADIESIVTKTERYQIFELSNALIKRDKVKAANIIESLSQHGIDDYAVFGNLVAFCRRLFYALNSKATDGVLASTLACHPYAIISLRRDARGIDGTRALKIYENALDLEYQIKSGKLLAERATILLAGLFL